VITDMPLPRPPFLNRFVSRHGKVMWAVRVGKGAQRQRVFIKAPYGTPEFEREYQAIISDAGRPARDARALNAGVGSLSWLIDRYKEVHAWTSLSPATRKQRENIFKQAIEAAGIVPIGEITKATIAAGVTRRSATPGQANHFLKAMRGLFQWAAAAEHVCVDPTADVKLIPMKKGAGFPIWTDEDVERYALRWPIGTRQRVWLDVLLYTGLRRGDAVRLGRQHVRDGVATIVTEKNDVEVTIPILPVLATTLKAGPCGDLAFISGESGRPLTKQGFSGLFWKACRAAGVPGSAHGLRKVAATRAANNGATVAEMEAIFGWTGGQMASHYTRTADRRRLARRAMHKLIGE
jgi:integrase